MTNLLSVIRVKIHKSKSELRFYLKFRNQCLPLSQPVPVTQACPHFHAQDVPCWRPMPSMPGIRGRCEPKFLGCPSKLQKRGLTYLALSREPQLEKTVQFYNVKLGGEWPRLLPCHLMGFGKRVFMSSTGYLCCRKRGGRSRRKTLFQE